jgi:DNA repair exonuclease SbcCD ATPase subunit
MPFEIAEHAIVLGQKKDLFLDLSPKAKMEVLSTAINLDRWEEYSDKARDRSRDLEKTLIEIDTELAAKTSLRNQGEQQLKTAKTRSSEWAAELKAQQKSLEERLKTINVSLTSQRNKLDDAELIYDGSGTELKALEQEIRRMQQTRDEAQKEYSKVELMLEGLEDVVGALKTELDGLGRDKDPCPTCGQSLKGTALAHHKREIEQSITKHKATIKTGVPTAIRTKLEVCVEELAKATEHADVFRDKVDDAQTTIRVVGPDVARLETTSRDLQRQLKEHEDTVNPHRAQVEELNKLLRKLDEQIEDLEDEQKDTTKTLTQTKFWVTGFKDVRLSLLQEFLHELELAANALLPESGLHNWRILFDIEKETNKGTIKPGLTVFIQSPSNKEPVRWESWSGGEAQRLRLVGSLALAEVLLAYMGVNTNLEILDEPTNGLSVSGVEDLCEFLARRAKKLDKDIFFIDHMATANRHFSNTFTVVKNKKGSYIE